MEQTPSEYLIGAKAGTFVAYITYKQMQVVYEKFPGTHELASLIISRHNRKELRLKRLLSVKGIERVFNFYTGYPRMNTLHPPLRMEHMASHLDIGVSTLHEHKAK